MPPGMAGMSLFGLRWLLWAGGSSQQQEDADSNSPLQHPMLCPPSLLVFLGGWFLEQIGVQGLLCPPPKLPPAAK